MILSALLHRRHVVAASQARRDARTMRPSRPRQPRAAQLAYTEILLSVTREIAAAIRSELAALGIQVRQDAADGSAPPTRAQSAAAVRRMRAAAARVVTRPGLVERIGAIGQATDKFSREEFARQARAAVGVEITTAVPGVRGMIGTFRTQNVSLIKALARDQVDKVRGVLDMAGVGTRVEDIADRIRDAAGVSEDKAALLARDQVLKLNAEITEARHAAAGITEYTWSTSHDERVRPDHAVLDGTRQSYADPPVVDRRTGDTGNPGTWFQCRCVAIPIIEGLDDD